MVSLTQYVLKAVLTRWIPLHLFLSPLFSLLQHWSTFLAAYYYLFPLVPLILVMPMKYSPWYFSLSPRNYIILTALSSFGGKTPNLRTSNLCDIQPWWAHPINSLLPTWPTWNAWSPHKSQFFCPTSCFGQWSQQVYCDPGCLKDFLDPSFSSAPHQPTHMICCQVTWIQALLSTTIATSSNQGIYFFPLNISEFL